MKDLRIVFMGTPEFAVASLGCLLVNDIKVVSVVTAPDKPAGRGRKIARSAVKIFAEENSLPVLQPVNLKDPEFISALKELQADLFVVVAFRMLPEVVWSIPGKGTINLHASLLPQYRGAAPINHVIINGETVTGVTTFFIDDKIDTGSILLREEVPVSHDETAGELHDRLMKHGARLILKTITGIADNSLRRRSQEEFTSPGEVLKTAPRIFPEFCIVDWNRDATAIYNFIRGLAPYPGARSYFRNSRGNISFKIFETKPEILSHEYIPGYIVSDGKNYIKIACADGFLDIIILQPEGKKKMSTPEFLRGFRISDYTATVS